MEELDKLETNQKIVSDSLELQGKDLESVEYLRNMMLDCALKQKQDMSEKIMDIKEGLKPYEKVGEEQSQTAAQDEMDQKSAQISAAYQDDVRDGADGEVYQAGGDGKERPEGIKTNEELVNVSSPAKNGGISSIIESVTNAISPSSNKIEGKAIVAE